MKIKKNLLAGLITLLILLVSACSASSTEQATVQIAEPEQPSAVVPEATQTYTSAPTETPRPTDTPVPSNTSTSTATIRPTKTPTALPENVEMVEMRTPDGIDLVGYLHRPDTARDDSLAVVLTHGFTGSHTDLADLEEIFVTNGYITMTFDYRGHGASPGIRLWNTLSIDTVTVFEFLKRQGFERIVCIGGSMGGLGCLSGATNDDISGVVMISSRMNPQDGSTLVTKTDLENLNIPKIFMIAEQDAFGPEFVDQFLEMAEIAAEPKDIYIYPGPSHAYGLLYDENGEEVISILLDFVNRISR